MHHFNVILKRVSIKALANTNSLRQCNLVGRGVKCILAQAETLLSKAPAELLTLPDVG